MREFKNASYWEVADICTGQFFSIGKSNEMYEVVDYAKHWNTNGMYDRIMVVMDSKRRYKVFKCTDLVGKKIWVY